MSAEEVRDEESPWHEAFQKRRCLVPAEAFYVWAEEAIGKNAYAVARQDGKTMALAGLWSSAQEGEKTIRSFALLIVPANGLLAEFGQSVSMPMVLDETDCAHWLGEVEGDMEQLFSPMGDDVLRAWPVGRRVNRRENDGQDLLDPSIEISRDDPLLSFRLRRHELRSLQAKLGEVLGRYGLDGNPWVVERAKEPLVRQHLRALHEVTKALASHLAAGERLFESLGRKRVPAAVWGREPAEDGYGHKEEIADFCAAMRDAFEIVCIWRVASGAEWATSADTTWLGSIWHLITHAPDQRLRDAHAWLSNTSFAARSGYQKDGKDLARAVEGAMRLAQAAVDGIDAAASAVRASLPLQEGEPAAGKGAA